MFKIDDKVIFCHEVNGKHIVGKITAVYNDRMIVQYLINRPEKSPPRVYIMENDYEALLKWQDGNDILKGML